MKYKVTFFLRDNEFIANMEFKEQYTEEEISIDIIARKFLSAKIYRDVFREYILETKEENVVIIPSQMEWFKIEEIK